jgi:hypothetical protein
MGRASKISMTAGFLMTALLMVGTEGLVAQRRGGGGQRAEMELRIQARFDNLVREDLDLSDSQMEQLQSVVEQFRGRRQDFFQRERNSRGRIAGLGAGGVDAELTEEQASEILAEMLELNSDEATLFQEEQEAFLEILSAPQVVRFIVLRQGLGDRIRRLRGGGGGGRGQQGGRRAAPPPRGI